MRPWGRRMLRRAARDCSLVASSPPGSHHTQDALKALLPDAGSGARAQDAAEGRIVQRARALLVESAQPGIHIQRQTKVLRAFRVGMAWFHLESSSASEWRTGTTAMLSATAQSPPHCLMRLALQATRWFGPPALMVGGGSGGGRHGAAPPPYSTCFACSSTCPINNMAGYLSQRQHSKRCYAIDAARTARQLRSACTVTVPVVSFCSPRPLNQVPS